MLQPIITAEELESANEDLRLEQEFTSLESYIDKFDGMTMMGHALNAMPKLSIESAALTEVASAILARGTDLSGADDFVPGLESMVVSGLEATNTGQGFLDKAKKVGAAIIEKIKALWARLIRSIKNLGTQVIRLIDKVADLKDKLLKAGDHFEYELPTYRAEALIRPPVKAITDFMSHGPVANMERLLKADDDESRMEEFKAAVHLYLKALVHVGKFTQSNTVEITEIPSEDIHFLKLATVENGKLTSGIYDYIRHRPNQQLKAGTVTKGQLTEAFGTISQLLQVILKWIKGLDYENNKVSDSISNEIGYPNFRSSETLRVVKELSSLHFFIYRKVPSVFIESLDDTLKDASQLIRTSN